MRDGVLPQRTSHCLRRYNISKLKANHLNLPAYGVRACWSTPVLNAAGGVLGTFGISWREPRSPTEIHQHIINQVTHLAAVAIERKQAEDAIRAAKSKFERILEIAEDAIISVNSSQNIVLFNQARRERIFGYSHSEVMGKLARSSSATTLRQCSHATCRRNCKLG